jgi:hypothetical protein
LLSVSARNACNLLGKYVLQLPVAQAIHFSMGCNDHQRLFWCSIAWDVAASMLSNSVHATFRAVPASDTVHEAPREIIFYTDWLQPISIRVSIDLKHFCFWSLNLTDLFISKSLSKWRDILHV